MCVFVSFVFVRVCVCVGVWASYMRVCTQAPPHVSGVGAPHPSSLPLSSCSILVYFDLKSSLPSEWRRTDQSCSLPLVSILLLTYCPPLVYIFFFSLSPIMD